MPFTPFHWGPSSWIGLLFFRFINIGAFLVGSVIIDIEPFCVLFFKLNYPLHGFLHSYLGSTIIAIFTAWLYYYFKTIINKFWQPFKLAQNSSFLSIFFSCLLGVYLHVLLDSFIYQDIKPFFPASIKPFYGKIPSSIIYSFCSLSFIIGGLLYFKKITTGKWKLLFKVLSVIALTATLLFVVVMYANINK